MKNKVLILSSIFFSLFANCKSKDFVSNKTNTEDKKISFISVSMEEGLEIMSKEKDFVLLDVRTPEEYSQGHLPGAVQLTNETFTKEDAAKLIPTKNQKIFVYCRSGRRSKNSSQKLVNFGYTNVVEIGGIISYKGELEN